MKRQNDLGSHFHGNPVSVVVKQKINKQPMDQLSLSHLIPVNHSLFSQIQLNNCWNGHLMQIWVNKRINTEACHGAECVESWWIGLYGTIDEHHLVTTLYVRNVTLTLLSVWAAVECITECQVSWLEEKKIRGTQQTAQVHPVKHTRTLCTAAHAHTHLYGKVVFFLSTLLRKSQAQRSQCHSQQINYSMAFQNNSGYPWLP